MFNRKLRCKVCGARFTPTADRRYTAIKDTSGTGLIAALGSSETPTYYDAFDCPACGCQIRLDIRLPGSPGSSNDSTEEAEVTDDDEH